MSSSINVSRADTLPSDLPEWMAAAAREDFEPMQWLRDDWETGANRFSKPGEAFYIARIEGRLVGVCGVNQEPFADDASIGRLRRLYVLPGYRRMGVGRQLVRRALDDSGEHSSRIRLRTTSEQGAAFFEAIGFRSVAGEAGVTHEKIADPSESMTIARRQNHAAPGG
jgi:N-acetylglutamate synthase-like GNAT family acetyltransferase